MIKNKDLLGFNRHRNSQKYWIDLWQHISRQKKWHFPTEKTRGELTKNAQFTRIFWDSPSGKSFVFQTFSLRLIRVFVPLSISFPIQWTPVNMRLLTFTDRLTLGERLVFRHLPWVFRRENLEFTAVNEWVLNNQTKEHQRWHHFLFKSLTGKNCIPV